MMEPALSAEEWAAGEWCRSDGTCPRLTGGGVELDGLVSDNPQERHAIAALCLHGQPFGFTWEDVRDVRVQIGTNWDKMSEHDYEEMERRLTSLADRIAALLPPEEK